MSSALARHMRSHWDRPERRAPEFDWFDRAGHAVKGRLFAPFLESYDFPFPYFARLWWIERRLKKLSDQEFKEEIAALRQDLRCASLRGGIMVRTFAVVREAARRATGMRPYDVQMLGGLMMIKGRIAEMRTGEGKTLTATLPAAAAALCGVPVHVLTVNDYLAERDAGEMRPVYEALGLSVGCIIHGMEHDERRKQYDCDVVYASNKELAFDYLRDQVELKKAPGRLRRHARRLKGEFDLDEKLLLKGLHFAIVDEADSVLLDEARTPLILAIGVGHGIGETKEVYAGALEIARQLEVKRDFTLDIKERRIEFTSTGEWRVLELTANLGAQWQGLQHRLKLIHSALVAEHLFVQDKDYIVIDGDVVIVDQHTGRAMPDRQWEEGLHQLIQVKEGCEITAHQETQARITYQKLFRRYYHLCGMTGTAAEVRQELWNIYGLPTTKVPTHRKVRLKQRGYDFSMTADEKWKKICARVKTLHGDGCAVLVGTQSVGDSEHLSALLQAENVPHRVLNARQDQEEAAIVAEAGREGKVTVATAMAGRGTDIKLSENVAERGGLHVILSEFQESARLDRQLAGRSARQGDPGSAEYFFSLEDRLFLDSGKLAASLAKSAPRGWGRKELAAALMRLRQRLNERKFESIRRRLLQADEREEEMLSLSEWSH